MKVKLSIISVLFCMACNQPEIVQEIGYTAVDPNLGTTQELVIRADSVHYTHLFLGAVSVFHDTTGRVLWTKLAGQYDAKAFKNIKGGGDPVSAYAPDRTFRIKTQSEEIEFTNGDASEAYQQMDGFFRIIMDLSVRCYERSIPVNMTKPHD